MNAIGGNDIPGATLMADTVDTIAMKDLAAAGTRIRELEIEAGELERVRGLLAMSESEYRTAFERSGTGMVVVDEDMTVILVNRRVRDIFGFRTKKSVTKRNGQNSSAPTKWND